MTPLQTATCADYFESFLPELRGQLLIPGLHSLSCVLGVALRKAPEERWRLWIASGRLTDVSRGVQGADCIFNLDRETLMAVIAGQLAPDRAFFEMRVEIEGNIVLGLQLSRVLEPFFRTHTYPGSAL